MKGLPERERRERRMINRTQAVQISKVYTDTIALGFTLNLAFGHNQEAVIPVCTPLADRHNNPFL